MAIFNAVRGRADGVATHVLASRAGEGVLGVPEDKVDGAGERGGSGYVSSDDNAEELSPAERNEKEVQRHGDAITADAEVGVQKVEAAALVWSRGQLYAIYAWIWVCFFMLALQQSILSNVTYYAYADFSAAEQLGTASILASIIGGVLKLPIAKVLNIWGRAEGFFAFLLVYLLGMILLAACNGPDSYAAGYVFYWIGYDALYFIMDVFVADTSGLRNRAFAFAFVSTPFICTAFTGPLAAQSFLNMTSWRWAIGSFCIIQFVVFSPLGIAFKYFQIKARKQGLFVRPDSGRSALQSTIHYFHEFDIVGALLLIASFVLFLLPFSLETQGRTGYQSAKFIVMVVIGVLLFPVFAVWEKYFARTHFIRWQLFRQPTVAGAALLALVIYYSFYAWDLYYYSFVMVVYDLSVSKAGYMAQIYNVGSCFWGVVFGLYVRWTKHFKWAALFFGLTVMLLGSGLMIRFRGQDANIGYIVMCQIFIAFGGGTLVIANQMAVMASSDRDGVPLLLALLALCNSVGQSVGYAVADAIYINTFPDALRSALPSLNETEIQTLYTGGYLTQMTYPIGSEIRNGVNYAWGQSQKWNCVSSTAFLALGIPAIMLWKNFNVDRKQNKGVVL